MTPGDLAQMRRILDRVALYRSGKIAINALIADVETILGSLETKDEGLRGRLLEKWGTLEEIYSYAMAMRGGEFDGESRRDLREAVDELEHLVNAIIPAEAGGSE